MFATVRGALNWLGQPNSALNGEGLSNTDSRAMRRNEYYPDSPRDVYSAAWTLKHFLPWELVEEVVNLAEYWVRLHVEEQFENLRIQEHTSPYPCAVLPIQTLNIRHPQPIRKATFFVEAHDQGVCSHPDLGAWTWFQVEVIPPASAGNERLAQHFATNRQADRSWQTHEQIWYHDEAKDTPVESESPRELLKHLGEGSKLQITAHAKFPGWKNYVRKARIEAFVAVLH